MFEDTATLVDNFTPSSTEETFNFEEVNPEVEEEEASSTSSSSSTMVADTSDTGPKIPRVGGVHNKKLAWTGPESSTGQPVSSLCYRIELTDPSSLKNVTILEAILVEGVSDDGKFATANEKGSPPFIDSKELAQTLLHEKGMEYLFHYVDLERKCTVNVFEEWGSFTDEVAETHCQDLFVKGVPDLTKAGTPRLPVCSYDVDNNRLAGRMLRNSMTREFASHCDDAIIKSEHGIKIFREILRVSLSINPSVTRNKVEELLKHSIKSVPAEDVEVHNNNIKPLLKIIEGSGHKPPDMCGIYLSTVRAVSTVRTKTRTRLDI